MSEGEDEAGLPAGSIARIEEIMTDLAMMELLFVSAPFRRFVLEHVGLAECADGELVSLRRSVFDNSLGETDVELVCRRPDGRRVALLIENKVRAPIMQRQFERYALRGLHGSAVGDWDAHRIVLMSPLAYFDHLPEEHRPHIDAHLPYETILDWLHGQRDPSLRFKQFVFGEALADARRGYAKQPDVPMMDFYMRYWEIASADFPELRMPRPGVVGKDGSWIYFPGLYGDNSVRLIHKFKLPSAELVIATRKGEGLEAAVGSLLEPGMFVRFVTSQAMVSLATPALDHRLEFATIEPAIRQSLEALCTLRTFALRHDVREAILRAR